MPAPDVFKVAVFDTLEAANEYRTQNRSVLRAPDEKPIALNGKYCVKVYGGPQVWNQTIGVIRGGVLTGVGAP